MKIINLVLNILGFNKSLQTQSANALNVLTQMIDNLKKINIKIEEENTRLFEESRKLKVKMADLEQQQVNNEGVISKLSNLI